jgi:hypothetical protein
MVNYKNSMIYTIRSYQTDKIYVGSTCNELRKRLYDHKSKYKKYLNGKHYYNTSFEIVKYDDCYIELYEKYNCNDKSELYKKEGETIRQLECVNKKIEGRTRKEYIQDNKQKISIKKKEYQQNNKEKLKQYHKKYSENNKEILLIRQKKYDEQNKEKKKEYRQLKYVCPCGSVCRIYEKAKHFRTKKHRTYLFNLHNEFNHL